MKVIRKFALYIMIVFVLIVSVNADDAVITVIMPNSTTESVVTTTEPAKKSSINIIYPISVTETSANGRREIVKTYELSPYEKPSDIPCDSFERDGYYYEIADMTKKENSKTEQRQEVEIVKLSSPTKDFDEILKLLDKSKEYKNGGFIGTLVLDVNTIKVEQAGSRSVAYTVTAVREYLYLSCNDTSYIPKTITQNGRNYALSDVKWRTQSSTAVDYDVIPDSYTAVATYSATAYKTVVTGYEITAEYRGIVSKTVTGKTVYTAVFIGTQIIQPTVAATTETPTTTEAEVTTVTETAETTEAPTETVTETTSIIETTPEITTIPVPEKPEKEPINSILIIVIIILAVGIIGSYFYFKRKIAGGITLK